MAVAHSAVNLVGSLLPGGVLGRIRDGDPTVPAIDARSYHLTAGESVRRIANRDFGYLRDEFHRYADQQAGTGSRRNRRRAADDWRHTLLRTLDFDGIERLPGGIVVDEQPFPVSHRWQQALPVHLAPWGADLDRRAAGVPRGTRSPADAAPHVMVQRLLNQSDQHLWAVLCNGPQLRLLRDSTNLAGSAYLEFDLAAIFQGELFADFLLFYRIAHASRFQISDPQAGAASCPLEEWRTYGARQGERALTSLRYGVHEALETLGQGFLSHPHNRHLRDDVAAGRLTLADLKRSLLRLVYKLIFWMVVEDRGVLLDPHASRAARDRYDTYFSSRRLRRLADTRRHSWHGDLWQSTALVFQLLGSEAGGPVIGLPALGGVFETSELDLPLRRAQLTNSALLTAVTQLSVLTGRRADRRQWVDWARLGADELGSVYEALLELHPCWDAHTGRFCFVKVKGSDRKKTGAYYTPPSLVDGLLDSTLEPLLDEACDADTPAERVAALERLTVCDPACGSGHFLIGAARRIARRIAIEETDDLEPHPDAVQAAMRKVTTRCLYGVDSNEMAVELAKLSLWLEAVEPGKPLGYLDAHLRVGNSLLGATPAQLAAGIPDAAYTALDGDSRAVVTALRRENASQSPGVRPLTTDSAGNLDLAAEAAAIAHLAPCETLADVHIQAQRDRTLDPHRRRLRQIADAWCAAFVAPKIPRNRAYGLTNAMLARIATDERSDDVERARQLVDTMVRQYGFFHWHIEFPHIFEVPADGVPADRAGVDPATGWRGGFSCVLTNPPWERVKLQEQEFFDGQHEAVAGAPNAAARKKLIAALADSEQPAERDLHLSWTKALRTASGISHLLRTAGRHRLTGRGDINTYAVFAETSRTLLATTGQVGIIVPTGIATDATTQDFFKDLVRRRSLVSLFDFENEDRVFSEVHHSFRFVLLTVAGVRRPVDRVSLVFRVRQVDQIVRRAYVLSPEEISLLNPNTGTCPVFMSRRDAEITLGIYRRVPVLWREDRPDGNPWGVSFLAMLHMANDSGLFRGYDDLVQDGWTLKGYHFVRGDERMLPLYEAKMVHFYDHRLGTYEGATQAQLNVGTLPRLTDADHDDPARLPLPRYWVPKSAVDDRLAGRWSHDWLLGWRDIAPSTNERTLIPAVIPLAAVGHTNPLLISDQQRVVVGSLAANLATLVTDYAARQKLSGTHLTYAVLRQLPVLPPQRYAERAPWDPDVVDLSEWIRPRALELTYTAHDLAPYARDLGDDGPPFRWDPQRRELIRAELDAAYFHLYGVDRDDVDHIMETFKVVRDKDENAHGEYRTKRLILERYDAMAAAVRTGTPYRCPLDPPPGRGRRSDQTAETRR
ncbi:Eco57I restriction-modification methylase domain-containing protein [Micromonospora sp. LOL_013]|uniref:Eco57I restriction-modification methylase domain-containing protein n=1 Tax=Micromonospora sp. LOL_013 TaxID=3345414 RepID=UPI003A8486B8